MDLPPPRPPIPARGLGLPLLYDGSFSKDVIAEKETLLNERRRRRREYRLLAHGALSIPFLGWSSELLSFYTCLSPPPTSAGEIEEKVTPDDNAANRQHQISHQARRDKAHALTFPESTIVVSQSERPHRDEEYRILYEKNKEQMTAPEFDDLLYSHGLEGYMTHLPSPPLLDLDDHRSTMPYFSDTLALASSYPSLPHLESRPAISDMFHRPSQLQGSTTPTTASVRLTYVNGYDIDNNATVDPALVMNEPQQPAYEPTLLTPENLNQVLLSYPHPYLWHTWAVAGHTDLPASWAKKHWIRKYKLAERRNRARNTKAGKKVQNFVARQTVKFEERPGCGKRRLESVMAVEEVEEEMVWDDDGVEGEGVEGSVRGQDIEDWVRGLREWFDDCEVAERLGW